VVYQGDWAAWNKLQRRDARRFVASKPHGVLVILGHCLAPLVKYLHVVEKSAGAAWSELQLANAVDGLFQSRVEEAISLGRVKDCAKDAPGAVL
jgi:hypothetical protein